MSVRQTYGSANSSCKRVGYGRKCGTPIFEIKSGDAKLVTVGFCDGYNECGGPSLTQQPTITTEECVAGTGGISATVKDWDGCQAQILIDAANAFYGEQYNITATGALNNCERCSECFTVKITGCKPKVSGKCDEEQDCDKYLGQQDICTDGVASLIPPVGTKYVIISVSSEAIAYRLDGNDPVGRPAIYKNIGEQFQLSYDEIIGFRVGPYCSGDCDKAALVASFYGC